MKKVDLIIPTFNRPKFLRRILDYYNSYNIEFNIIIADSSSPENKARNKKLINAYSKLKILYIDKFPQNLPPHKKYAEMVKFAKSKYVCFCPDDDFIIPNGIKECVDFLEKNPDYSTAQGTYISFYVHKSLFRSKKFWWRFIYPYQSITLSNPINRLISHLNHYYQVLWAVRRTDVVKHAYKEFLKSKVDPFLFGELTPDMLTLIFGKMKRINVFYSARQAFSTSYSYWPSLLDSIKVGTFDKEYAKFKNCLVYNLYRISHIPKEKAAIIIDSNMKTYLKTTFQEHLTGRVNLLLKHFPSFIENNVRFLHIRYLFFKKNKDKIGLIDNPSSKYYSDFESIQQLVLKYSNES